MTTDIQAKVAVRVAIAQIALTALIAVFSGYWAYATHTADQRRTAEALARERRDAHNAAIAQMSRQIGLMQAQCEEDVQLRTLLDDAPTRRKEGCYDAYLGARSLLFLSRAQITPDPSIAPSAWAQLWDDFQTSLVSAGARNYREEQVSDAWESIVSNSKQP